MIRGGFLSAEDRKLLIALARDGPTVGRVTRRANALVFLDGGMSCQEVAGVLLFDDDTIRNWHAMFEQGCNNVQTLSNFQDCRLPLTEERIEATSEDDLVKAVGPGRPDRR